METKEGGDLKRHTSGAFPKNRQQKETAALIFSKAAFVLDLHFSGKLPKYVVADLRLLSVHSSIACESKWRYIMKKVNLRDLYHDVYKTDHFVEVTEDMLETIRDSESAEAAYDRRSKRHKEH